MSYYPYADKIKYQRPSYLIILIKRIIMSRPKSMCDFRSSTLYKLKTNSNGNVRPTEGQVDGNRFVQERRLGTSYIGHSVRIACHENQDFNERTDLGTGPHGPSGVQGHRSGRYVMSSSIG